MQSLKSVKILLFTAVLMVAAKPFLGFRLASYLTHCKESTILVKAFTKRKLEHHENSEFNLHAVQQRLANPDLAPLLRFSFLLAIILPAIFNFGKTITARICADINSTRFMPQARYLLAGQLII